MAVGEEQDGVELIRPERQGDVEAPPPTEDPPVQLQVPWNRRPERPQWERHLEDRFRWICMFTHKHLLYIFKCS